MLTAARVATFRLNPLLYPPNPKSALEEGTLRMCSVLPRASNRKAAP